MIVGTTLIHVQRCASTCSQKVVTLNRWGITTLPPCTSGATVVTIWPLIW